MGHGLDVGVGSDEGDHCFTFTPDPCAFADYVDMEEAGRNKTSAQLTSLEYAPTEVSIIRAAHMTVAQLVQHASIMTGVYQRWCSSTLHIGWGLCDRVCQVLVCRGRYGFGGGGSSLHSWIEFGLQEQIKDIIIIGVGQ